MITIIKNCFCGFCGKQQECKDLTPIGEGFALCASCLEIYKEN